MNNDNSEKNSENEREYIFSKEIDRAINDYIIAKNNHVEAIKKNYGYQSDFSREMIKKTDGDRRAKHNELAILMMQKGFIAGLNDLDEEERMQEARDSAKNYVEIYKELVNINKNRDPKVPERSENER